MKGKEKMKKTNIFIANDLQIITRGRVGKDGSYRVGYFEDFDGINYNIATATLDIDVTVNSMKSAAVIKKAELVLSHCYDEEAGSGIIF